MTDDEFDGALIAGAFAIAARDGWRQVTAVAAAREAGLPLDRARTRFADSRAILLRFGSRADAHALSDSLETGPVRERLFDVVMRRFDALQAQRAGVIALLRGVPADPGTALLLAAATSRSMAWMLASAGVKTAGLAGALATQGLVAVWLYTLRAWEKDESPDLSGTMAALDRALTRAERAASWLSHKSAPDAATGPKPFPEPPSAPEASLSEAEEAGVIGVISGAAETPPPESGAI